MSSRWTYADLNLAAVAQRRDGRDTQIRLWYRLRNPAGVVHWPDVFAAGQWLRWSRRSLLRVLAGGAEIYWSFARRGLYLHGTARVAAGLGVTQIRAKFPLRPAHLRGSLAMVRARLGVRAVAALRQGLPIANVTKCTMLQISRPTLKHWEQLSRVQVIANLQLVAPLKRSTPEELWRASGELGLLTVRYCRRMWVARRLPNSYRPVRDTRSRRRSLRNLNRKIPVPGGEQAPSRIPDRGAVLYATPELLQSRAGSSSRTQGTTPPRYVFLGETRAPDAFRFWRASFPGSGGQDSSLAGEGLRPCP